VRAWSVVLGGTYATHPVSTVTCSDRSCVEEFDACLPAYVIAAKLPEISFMS
jgi:hypothetical protein